MKLNLQEMDILRVTMTHFIKKTDRFFFFTGTHEDYHQLSDHIEKLDFDQMLKITKLGSKVVEFVLTNGYTPQFISHLSWMGVSLTTHDSVAKIIKVEEGSRADEVGMKEGDTILSLNGEALESGQISLALRELTPGKSTQIQIQRASENITMEITRAKTLCRYLSSISSNETKQISHPENEGVLIAQAVEGGPLILQVCRKVISFTNSW